MLASGKRDAFDREPQQATRHPRRAGKFLFSSRSHQIQNVGDICAAGILPILKQESGEINMLLAEEDMNMGGKNWWSHPVLQSSLTRPM